MPIPYSRITSVNLEHSRSAQNATVSSTTPSRTAPLTASSVDYKPTDIAFVSFSPLEMATAGIEGSKETDLDGQRNIPSATTAMQEPVAPANWNLVSIVRDTIPA